MNASNYIEDLTRKLGALEKKIAEARKRLETGEPADMVKAAGELAVLEAKKRGFAENIAAAEARHAENWSALHTELAEEYDAIMNNLQNWVTRH